MERRLQASQAKKSEASVFCYVYDVLYYVGKSMDKCNANTIKLTGTSTPINAGGAVLLGRQFKGNMCDVDEACNFFNFIK